MKIAWNTGYVAYNVTCLHSLHFDSMQLHVCMQYGLIVCEFLLNVHTNHSIVPHHEQQMNQLKNILHYKMANLGLHHISINFIL